MPNRFTAVPEEPVPKLGFLGSVLLPLADSFMKLMFSKPASGTLRTTWVTPATLWLTLVSGIAALGLGIGLAVSSANGNGGVILAGIVICIAYAAGALAVALVGFDQRR
jgi:hypothetical protein